MARNAEFSARDTNDNGVLDNKNRARAGFTLLRVTVHDFPNFFTGLGVESDQRRVCLMQEDLAFCILHTAVNVVAAENALNRRVLLWLVLPDDLVFVCKVQSEHVVRECRVKIHHVADHEGRAFVSAKNASRE